MIFMLKTRLIKIGNFSADGWAVNRIVLTKIRFIVND